MAQSDRGKIELFYDFFGEDNVAETASTRNLGPFVVGGQGSEATDAGILTVADALSGVGRITSTDEPQHCTLVGTNTAFSPSLNGPIVLEARVQFNNTATKMAYFGLSSIDPDVLILEGGVGSVTTGTITNDADDLCGFAFSIEATATADWHMVYKGGSASASVTAASFLTGNTIVAAEWQVLRLEIDTNGTARWYVDGDLKQTVVGAVSTTEVQGVCLGVEAKGADVEEMDVDYLLVQANRDWTV